MCAVIVVLKVFVLRSLVEGGLEEREVFSDQFSVMVLVFTCGYNGAFAVNSVCLEVQREHSVFWVALCGKIDGFKL